MKRKGWYLVAYDIANPSRLSKIHRKLKSEGLAVQKSLFLVQGTEFRINQLLDHIASLMTLRKDDLRAYPIMHPSKIWTNGLNPMADFPALHFGTKKKNFKSKTRKKQKKSLWKRLLGL